MSSKNERNQLTIISICFGLGEMIQKHLPEIKGADRLSSIARESLDHPVFENVFYTRKQQEKMVSNISEYLQSFVDPFETVPMRALTSACLGHLEDAITALNIANRRRLDYQRDRKIRIFYALLDAMLFVDEQLEESQEIDEKAMDRARKANLKLKEILSNA